MTKEVQTNTGRCSTHGTVQATREIPETGFPFVVYAIWRALARRRPYLCPDCGAAVQTDLAWPESQTLLASLVLDVARGQEHLSVTHRPSRVSRPASVRLDTDRAEAWRLLVSPGRTVTMGGPMAGYVVAHLDEIEEFADAGCRYRPIRHHLGITAFGVTAWTARAAGDLVINEHDEDDPTADQELFLVLRGHAVFELDGDRVDAPAGTLVFASPRTRRTASAKQEGTTIIALEGTPGKAYQARGWELWAPLAPLYQAGEYAEVADRLGALVAAAPQYPMLFFNLACCESQCGRTSDALDHLRHAIEMSAEFRDSAKNDSDLDPIRDEPAFKQLISD